MLIDMTTGGFLSAPQFPLSNYKVAYFRIPQWEKVKDGLINGNPPVLEICLIPIDSDGVKSFKNEWGRAAKGELAFTIPPEALIIKCRVGDDWPDIEKLGEQFKKNKAALEAAKEEEDEREAIGWETYQSSRLLPEPE
jgi:hypothetical protein